MVEVLLAVIVAEQAVLIALFLWRWRADDRGYWRRISGWARGKVRRERHETDA